MKMYTPLPRYKLQLVREESSLFYGMLPINDSKLAYNILKSHFEDLPHEEFVVLYLDTKYNPIGYQVISIGTLSLSLVHPREVFKGVCLANAAAIICYHNHPSDDPTPSKEDRVLTDRLQACAKLLGITLLDHIVISHKRYVSFKDEGWLNHVSEM